MTHAIIEKDMDETGNYLVRALLDNGNTLFMSFETDPTEAMIEAEISKFENPLPPYVPPVLEGYPEV